MATVGEIPLACTLLDTLLAGDRFQRNRLVGFSLSHTILRATSSTAAENGTDNDPQAADINALAARLYPTPEGISSVTNKELNSLEKLNKEYVSVTDTIPKELKDTLDVVISKLRLKKEKVAQGMRRYNFKRKLLKQQQQGGN